MIYFIRGVGTDCVKIGYVTERVSAGAAAVENRRKAMQANSPIELSVEGYVNGGTHEETYLHARYSDRHSHNEWFRLSTEEVRALCRELAGVFIAGSDKRRQFLARCVAENQRMCSAQAAEALGIAPKQIAGMIQAGLLPAERHPRFKFCIVRPQHILQLLATKQPNAADDAPVCSGAAGSGSSGGEQ